MLHRDLFLHNQLGLGEPLLAACGIQSRFINHTSHGDTSQALRSGARVVVGDSPGRAGRAAFLEELQNLGGLPSGLCQFNKSVKGRRCIGPRHDLICGEGSTSVVDNYESTPNILDGDDNDCSTYQELSVAILDLSPSDLIPSEMQD